jgi:nucleoside-diphosphate-sugar epimerase
VENLLERGYDITVLVRSSPKRKYPLAWLRAGCVKVIHGDITDASKVKVALKDVDVVFHLAALLGKWGIPDPQYYHVNVYGTHVMLEQSAKVNVEQFIYLSSTGVMGRLITLPADINHPCNPITAYEKSKYQAELLVRKSINEEHFPATIIRSTHVYGPRDYNTLQVYKLMKKLRVLPLPNGGRSLFQPIYVTDLVQAFISCMLKKNASIGKTYIVAGDKTITFKDFLVLSAKAMGIDIKIIKMPVDVMRILGSTNEKACKFLGLMPIITKSRIEFFARNHLYNNKPIMDELGWFPETELEVGLFETIQWYRKHDLL